MKIQVLRNFGGRLTHERRILPGEYDGSDERLFGLAQYLVDNGHALLLEADPEPEPAPAPEPKAAKVKPEPPPNPKLAEAEARLAAKRNEGR